MYRPVCKIQNQTVGKHETMKHLTFYQDVHLMQILTPNGLKKLRSEKITYCLS